MTFKVTQLCQSQVNLLAIQSLPPKFDSICSKTVHFTVLTIIGLSMTSKVTWGQPITSEVNILAILFKLPKFDSICSKTFHFTGLTFIGLCMTFKVTEGQPTFSEVSQQPTGSLHAKFRVNWFSSLIDIHKVKFDLYRPFLTFKVTRGQLHFQRSVRSPLGP